MRCRERAQVISLPLLLGFAALIAACGGGGGDDRFVVTNAETAFVPVIESTDLAVGVDRIVVRLLDRTVAPTFAEGTTFQLRFFEPVEGGVRFRSDTEATVVTSGAETYYIAPAPLDVAGTWELAVRASGTGGEDDVAVSARLPFVVGTATTSPAVGSVAPGSQALSEEVSKQRPVLVVLTLTGDCSGRGLCERALAQAEELAGEFGLSLLTRTALLDSDGGRAFQEAWSLENDPWIYVVGTNLVVLARFERVATEAELRQAIERLQRCFTGSGEIAALAGSIVPHGVAPGDPIPAGVLALLEDRRFDAAEFERTAFDDRELGLFAAGPSRSRPGLHDVALTFVLVEDAEAGTTNWVMVEGSWLVEAECRPGPR